MQQNQNSGRFKTSIKQYYPTSPDNYKMLFEAVRSKIRENMENKDKFFDAYEEQCRNLAKKQVDRIPKSLLDDIGPLVILERNYHLGVDAFGNRLSPDEWDLVKRTKETLRTQLAQKYSNGDVLDFDSYLSRYNVGNLYVKKEIVRRSES